MVDGIEINQDDADNSLIPEDLNSLAVGSYIVPNPNKRKFYPVYVILILVCTYVASLFLNFINFNLSIIILLAVSLLLLLVNNKFLIPQEEVIENILSHINHSIGYYSIALTFLFNFKNILTPVWTVIVYSHESPPNFKTIVEISAFSGNLLSEPYTESINA